MKNRLRDMIDQYHFDDNLGKYLDTIKNNIDKIDMNRAFDIEPLIRIVFEMESGDPNMVILEGDNLGYYHEIFRVGF